MSRRNFRKQLERVNRFLETRPKRERGVILFAGPKAWRALRLQVAVGHELHWGRASLTQFLWLLDEHQPYGVAVVDHFGARFYRFWRGKWKNRGQSGLKSTPLRWKRTQEVAAVVDIIAKRNRKRAVRGAWMNLVHAGDQGQVHLPRLA